VVSCHFKKLFIIENTLKIILTSLFKTKIYCNFLIIKLKITRKFDGKFHDKLKRAIKLHNFKGGRVRAKCLKTPFFHVGSPASCVL